MASVPDMLTELGDYGFKDLSPTTKVRAINQAYWDICSREPWPFLEKELVLTFNGSTDYASNAPTDLSAVLKIVNPNTGVRLVAYRSEDVEENYATSIATIGTPILYYFLSGTLKFTPIPASSLTYRMKYISYPAELRTDSPETDILLPARHHEALILGAASRLAGMQDDTEMGSYHGERMEKKLTDMKNDLWRRQYDSPDFIRPVEDYDYYYIC